MAFLLSVSRAEWGHQGMVSQNEVLACDPDPPNTVKWSRSRKLVIIYDYLRPLFERQPCGRITTSLNSLNIDP